MIFSARPPLTRLLRARNFPLGRHSGSYSGGCTAIKSFGSNRSSISMFSSTPVMTQEATTQGEAGISGVSSSAALEAFREIVISRTAAKSFSNTEIEGDVIRDIMALTQSAPSAFNIQPWSVVLVRDAAARERLSTSMLGGNAKKVLAAPVTAVFCSDLEPSKRIHRMAELNRRAGMPEADIAKLSLAVNLFSGEGLVGNVVRNAVTVIASPMQPSPEVGSAEAWSFKNTALAVQTYVLACTAYGLATAPMEGFDARRVRAALDIPDRYGIPMVVCTGYPAPSKAVDGREKGGRPAVKRWRYPSEEVVFDGAFGIGMRGIAPVVD